jgi:hypothetical protein
MSEWQKERPEKPGWYWWRSSYHDSAYYEIKEIRMIGDGTLKQFCCGKFSELYDGHWYGPIEQPR